MKTSDDGQYKLQIFESPSNLFILMDLLEEFTHLCYTNEISFWIDWGTALGEVRHSNIIPWDIDCDLCFTEDNYEKLLSLFEKHENTIGNLICYPDGYNDRHGCCWVQNKKYLEFGADIFGIDCVSHKLEGNVMKTLMCPSIVDAYPATPLSYDFSSEELFPLKCQPMVGNYVMAANKGIERIKTFYGTDQYLAYPKDEYNEWLKYNSNKLFLLNSPLKTVSQVTNLKDGLDLSLPFIIKNANEFDVDTEKLKGLFIQEHQILSWYETKQEIFTEKISNDAKQIIEQWENDHLTSNVIDSPCSHYEFLPKILYDRIVNLEGRTRQQALCYILTNKNNLTKFHCDVGGGGWIYLKQGKKLWWFISPQHLQELEKLNVKLESLRELSFTELVFLHDHRLWGKIYVALQEENDFICFPENWAHRVFTYNRAIGIGGYVK